MQPENPPSPTKGSGAKKNPLREFFSLGEVGRYFFRRKDPNRPSNVNIKIMHGINKLAILIFLVALIIWLVKRFF